MSAAAPVTPHNRSTPARVEAASAPPSARSQTRRAWTKVLRLSLCLAILVAIFTQVPLAEVAAVLARARPLPILAALALSVLTQFLVAHRLKRLTDAHDLGLRTPEVFAINLSTLFYGLFVPAGNFVGIAVRFYRLAGAERKIAAAAVALLLDRIAATATLCLVGAGFWFLQRPPGTAVVPLILLGSLLAMTLVIALLATPLRLPGIALITQPLLKVKKLRSLREALHDSRALPRRELFPLTVISIAAHLLGIAGYFLVAVALGVDVSWVSAGWLRSSMIFAAMLPISVAGLGVREGTAVALLGSFGVAAEEAVAFSLLAFAITVVFPALLGGLVELRRVFRAPGERPTTPPAIG